MNISEAYAKALTEGRRDGKGGLSARSVHHCHTILKQALGQAVRWRILPYNPTEAVEPPRVERGTMTTYDLAQTGSLLNATRGTRMFVPTMLAVLCGLRRGEICGLVWKHVDLAAGQLAVTCSAEQTKAGVRYKEPKSGRARTVALSATVVEELRRHRLEQAEGLLRLGVRATEDAFVFAQLDGAPYPPDRLTRAWISFAEKSPLPRIRFHDLRHAHATHLLGAGVHPKVASERLGHSRVGITLDLYSHATPGMQREAADIVDAALQKAIKGDS
jgi:integrase